MWSSKWKRILVSGLVLLAASAVSVAPVRGQTSPRGVLAFPGASSVVTVPQNWSDAEAQWFYRVPQGSKLVRYDWFLVLEMPDSETLFRSKEHMQALGYIACRDDDDGDNHDGLPIGFVRDGRHLGLTCSACHTGMLRFGDKDYLIDGAPTQGDFETMLRQLAAALRKTADEPAKFERFAARILGPGATPAKKDELRRELQKAAAEREAYNGRDLPRTGGAPYGPGRVDAFGAIMNEIASTFGKQPNVHFPADAPVSYPFLWDTPQHDKVQWNGAAPNKESALLAPILGTVHVGALGRNVGEVLGVFGTAEVPPAPALLVSDLGGYPSSVRKNNLIDIEERLRKLWSPQWPRDFGEINQADWQAGKQLFHKHCADCHDDNFPRTADSRRIEAKMDFVGTDQTMARNFATRRAKTGIFERHLITLPGFRRFGPEAPVKELLAHAVQRVVIGDRTGLSTVSLNSLTPQFTIHAELRMDDSNWLVGQFDRMDTDAAGKVKSLFDRSGLSIRRQDLTNRIERILTPDDSDPSALGRFLSDLDEKDGFNLAERVGTKVQHVLNGTEVNFKDPVEVRFKYKGRPLNGIWATAPYLHNGSVPNLDELLKAPGNRVKTFRLGSRKFDPVKVGLEDDGPFKFDTQLPGNSNAGHDYAKTFPPGKKEFTAEERRALVTYMKSL